MIDLNLVVFFAVKYQKLYERRIIVNSYQLFDWLKFIFVQNYLFLANQIFAKHFY